MNRRSVVVRQWPVNGLVVAIVAVVLIAIVSGYLMYDYGLTRAGFIRSAASDEIDALQVENEELQRANKSLSERIAVLETAAKIDREAYRQVDEQLAELQSRILSQQEDIEFYRGIVGEDDGSALRIQAFRVLPGLGEREFEFSLVLAQALRSSREVGGRVELAVEGLQRSEPALFKLSELGQPADDLNYSFLYFQDLKATIRIPADFEPQRVRVTVRPRGKGSKTVEEFFVWQPETG